MLTSGPRTPQTAELDCAVEKDACRQLKYGVKKLRPSMARMVLVRMRRIEAGELAGRQNRFGGIGTLLADPVGIPANQDADSRFLGPQAAEWRHTAGDKRNVKLIVSQLVQPFMWRLIRGGDG